MDYFIIYNKTQNKFNQKSFPEFGTRKITAECFSTLNSSVLRILFERAIDMNVWHTDDLLFMIPYGDIYSYPQLHYKQGQLTYKVTPYNENQYNENQYEENQYDY